MKTRPIEERVETYHRELMDWDKEYIPIHSDDVPAVMKSKVFKAESIDGCPAFGGCKFRMIGYARDLEY